LRCWLKTTVERIEVLLDHLERQVLVALRKKNIAESI
jgi:hypothetical protein